MPIPLVAIAGAVQLLNLSLPVIHNIITHYVELKNDDKLSETDLARMEENLLGLQLRDKEEL